jgi:hypothetical protein
MQDNAQRSDRHEVANAQPEMIVSGERDEELYRLFQSLFEATRTAHDQAAAGDFSGIQEHLQQRGRILKRVNELSKEDRRNVVLIQDPLKGQLHVMLQSTQQENIRLLQLIHERKKNVLSKIVEVQNRRHVFDYLR